MVASPWRAHPQYLEHDFLVEKNVAVLMQPSYSPDLAPYDFSFFSKSKAKSKGSIDAINALNKKTKEDSTGIIPGVH